MLSAPILSLPLRSRSLASYRLSGPSPQMHTLFSFTRFQQAVSYTTSTEITPQSTDGARSADTTEAPFQSPTQTSSSKKKQEGDAVIVIQADFDALLSQVLAHMPPFNSTEFQSVSRAVREIKRTEGGLPTSEQALYLLYAYLHRARETHDSTAIQEAWLAYNDLKASLYQEKALPLVRKHMEKKVPSTTGTTLSKVQQYEERALQRQIHRIGPDKLVYDAFILHLALFREFDLLNKVFHDMRERELFTPSIYRGFEPDMLTFNILLAAFSESGNVAGALTIYDALFAHKIIPEATHLELILKTAAVAGDCRTFARFFYRLKHKNQPLHRNKLRYLLQIWGRSLRLDLLRQQDVQCKDVTLTLELALRAHNYFMAITLISQLKDLGLRMDATMAETFLRACLRDRYLSQDARALIAKLRYIYHSIVDRSLLNELMTFMNTRIPEHIRSLGLPLTHAVPPPAPPSPPRSHVTRRQSREQYLSPEELERRRTRQRYVSKWSDDEKLFLFVPHYKARLEAEKRQQQLAQQRQQLQAITSEVDKELLQARGNPTPSSTTATPNTTAATTNTTDTDTNATVTSSLSSHPLPQTTT
jgi:hypothetical protein